MIGTRHRPCRGVQGYAVSIARMVDLPALAPALARLERTALDSHPFFGPAALEAARTVLPEVRAARLLLVADAAGELAACLPLRPTVSGLLPRPVEPLDHPYCFLRAPLVRAADAERALAALLDGLGRLELGGPALRLPDVAEGPLLEALHRAAAERGARLVETGRRARALMVPAACAETFLAGALPRKRRKWLARLHHRLARIGAPVFEVIARPAGLEAAIARFLDLEAAGWKGRAGTALAVAGHARFLEHLAGELAPTGRPSVPVLRLGERPLAMLVRLDSAAPDGTSYLFKIAFDEVFAHFAPGVLLVVEYTRWRHERGLRAPVDSCARSGHPLFERLWPGRRRLVDLLVLPPTPTGHVAAPLLQGLIRLRARWRRAAGGSARSPQRAADLPRGRGA